MVSEKSLVIYKNRPALVTGREADKISIAVIDGGDFKVREKDIVLLHSGPCTVNDMKAPAPEGNVREAWELLASDVLSLKELTELVYGVYSPRAVWAAYELLLDGLYFTGDTAAIRGRPRAAVEEDEKKREEKQQETQERSLFLEKFKKLPPFKMKSESAGAGDSLPGETLSSGERRFLQDVEALAQGKTAKSRTMKDLGRSETPEDAHRLLLASGAWTVWDNPHPGRFGLGFDSAKIVPPSPPEEERLDLTGLAAYAIDNPWSNDPDDAVSLEGPDAGGRYCLWVHVADPAASILPGSPADIEARGRGATLYLPEGASRMLAPETLPLFALDSESAALSFKITLKPDLTVEDTEIYPSRVIVTRLTYEEADALITGTGTAAASTLAALSLLAERNAERRLDTGAVMIELPDIHIQIDRGDKPEENRISVTPMASYRSAEVVRECMILAGEGAARWALQKQLPFPFIGQEAGDLPNRRLDGLAGAWQLRRCMRPRSISVKPAVHWGLGLDFYTQVTSPLRRYVDLLCHQQIRARLNSGAYRGLAPLGEEEVLLRLAGAEAAASAVTRAERASKTHWIAVYLWDKKDSVWEAVVLDRKGNRGTVIIPALGLETQVNLKGTEEPNDKISLSVSSVKIPEGEVLFV